MWSSLFHSYLSLKWIASILLPSTTTAHFTYTSPAYDNSTLGKDPITNALTVDHISAGGKSRCISGNINLTVTAQNFEISYAEPSNQFAATEFIVELLQVNSTLAQRLVGGPRLITGTYSIYSTLCVPVNPETARKVKTVQFLTHGDTLSGSYWDIAPEYSYVDAVTTAGQAAFFYDRIGVGRSDHPDSIQVVQGPLQVEIAHALVQLLRTNQVGQFKFSNFVGQYKFSNFVGVGHSAGSTVTQGVTTKYPNDFDAIILTGITTITTYLPLTIASSDFQVANQASNKFRDLSNGYLTQSNAIGVQYAYFHYPNFDPAIFQITYNDRQTNAIGEILTLGAVLAPSPRFIGPVDVVLGENDQVFCGSNCSTPTDLSAAFQPVFYPNAAAGYSHFLVPGTGHSINAHFGARASWDHQLDFLKENGFY